MLQSLEIIKFVVKKYCLRISKEKYYNFYDKFYLETLLNLGKIIIIINKYQKINILSYLY